MKRLRSLLLALALCFAAVLTLTVTAQAAGGDVAVDETNFPDDNFRSYVSANFDADSDGVLSPTEIAAVTEIKVSDKGFSSLKGVEYFTALKTLWCSRNSLTGLDVSKNTALEELACTGIYKLTSLDVSKNTALKRLYCYGNQLVTLNVTGCTKMTYLSCGENQLGGLNVSKNTALTYLSCYSNNLASLDVSSCTALNTLSVGGNQLTTLDVSRNTALKQLDCGNNQLESLDVSHNRLLESLGCGNNHQLASLNLKGCTALKVLWCYNNDQLTSLDVSGCTALTSLDCYRNQLTSLNVDGCTELKTLYCYENQLTSLDVSSSTALKSLNCRTNALTTLKLGRQNQLYALYCYGSNIATLDIGGCELMVSAYLNGSKTQVERDGVTCWSYIERGQPDRLLFVDLNTEILTSTLQAPAITAVGNTSAGKPVLTWNAVEGAAKYAVYRSGTSAGTYTKMYTTANTGYTNTSAKPGYTYYYKVCAVDSSGKESFLSSPVGVHCRPAPPEYVVPGTRSGKPYLSFSESDGAEKYVIYRSESENGTYTRMYTTVNTRYTNTSAEIGKTYWYKIYAVDKMGYWSAARTPVCVQCRPAAPVITLATVSASGKPYLEWNAVTGASKYVVYRAASRYGSYYEMFTTSNTHYTNLSAEAGCTYWYKVYAVSDGDCWSSTNTPVSVTATE